MKKIVFLFLFSPILLSAQDVVFKMGGVKFQNCKTILNFRGQEILSVRQAADGSFLLNADVFNEAGTLVATVRDNTPTGRVELQQETGKIMLLDKSTKRIICEFVKDKWVTTRVDIAVTLNYYLPNGKMLQCTPEDSSHPSLIEKKNVTVVGSVSAMWLK